VFDRDIQRNGCLPGRAGGQNPFNEAWRVRQTERDLLLIAVGGDQNALATLLEKYTPLLRMTLAGKMPRRWQSVLSVDDVIQETCVDVFLDIGSFPVCDGRSFRRWLATIAKRNLLDAIRMLKADKRGGPLHRIDLRRGEESYMALYELMDRSSARPSRLMAKKEAEAALQEAIQALPDLYRRVVVMYDLEGRRVNELAALLGRSPGSVFMLRARAHRKLADFLGSRSRFLGA